MIGRRGRWRQGSALFSEEHALQPEYSLVIIIKRAASSAASGQ